MTRRTLQTCAAALVLTVAGSGCSLSKISWWPWGSEKPAPAQPVNQPSQIAKHNPGFQPPNTNLVIAPKPKPKPPPIPAPVDINRNSQANFKLAQELETGGNLSAAVPLYQRAAEQNLREAQYTIGLMHATGEGLPQDETKAAAWFAKSAALGLAEAQQFMGIYHEQGKGGLPKDFTKAAVYYLEAAKQGYADAQYHLGYLHVKGQGVPASYEDAAKWFLRAAENNVPDAQYQIGFYLARGTGVEQDVTQAYKWLTVAKLNNHQRAKTHWAELQGIISEESKTEGIRLANEFLARQREKR